MIFIKDWVLEQRELMSNGELAIILDVQPSTTSRYKTQSIKPSLTIAINIYLHDSTVVYPYSEESIVWTIANS